MASSNRHQHKRHGKHQKHTPHFLKVYSPYIPMLMIIVIGLILSIVSPPRFNKSVLAYATSMSSGDLLSSTNQKRSADGKSALALNSKLNSAAQSKANDMVSRNYWSHETPDGQQPWVFIVNAGYSYQAAAENLAYGYANASDTVNGWMGSTTHRTNMLNSAYTEVGFGYANAPSYIGDGKNPPAPQTVIVAMYAKPAAVSSSNGVASANTSNNTTPTASSQPSPSQTSSPATTNQTTTQSNSAEKTEDENQTPVQTTAAATEPATQSVNRVSAVTGRNYSWIMGASAIIVVISCIMLAARHFYAFHRWLKHGERYLLHHFVFDVTIISLIGLCFVASQTVGFIK